MMMTLKEKFKLPIDAHNKINNYVAEQSEKIADDFAIGFAEWYFAKCHLSNSDMYRTTNELLEIYKKETGL